MRTAGYVSLSGQIALEQRLAAAANNVANAGTVGFRAETAGFSEYLSRASPTSTHFAVHAGTFADSRGGGLSKTGNPLDVAIQGEGFLALQTPAGMVYTRDGRMQVLTTGDLVSLNGHPVLDVGGAPLTVDPAGGTLSIARDGMISQAGQQIGAIGLFKLDLQRGYTRYENSGFLPSVPPEPILTFSDDGVVQGFTEESNVNAVLEMTNLIRITRAFEALGAALDQQDSAQRSAMQALSGRG